MAKMRPVLTVTLNPAVDYAVTLQDWRRGHDHRVDQIARRAGGKGVNVARGLLASGTPAVAAGLLGTGPGDWLSAVLTAEGIPQDFTRTSVPARMTFTLSDGQGEDTRVLEHGLFVKADVLRTFEQTFSAWLPRVCAVVLSGGLPPGLRQDIYARLIRAARPHDLPVFLDTSGPALVSGLKAHPAWVKPNRAEAEALLGQRLSSRRQLRTALRDIQTLGRCGVLLSLGADGAALGVGKDVCLARVSGVQARHTVGCGDALLAGFIHAHVQGWTLPEALRYAVAAGTAHAQTGRFLRKTVTALAKQVELTPL